MRILSGAYTERLLFRALLGSVDRRILWMEMIMNAYFDRKTPGWVVMVIELLCFALLVWAADRLAF